ncbi:acyl-CoA ligase (AMP-forming), exosortase A system-associated [Sphingomonas sp. KR1UV-12]|uniref:Acyl-CoA ligase (AMP-forming), exosortase A system-associated n=1 Tax=Sphingomonas aurea TaxID=3063994 RepID=A0ABT9EGA2_9SPHN|nr:acyl-CoA ligase (AMP-forming), exosortase A system-associated [Sphingomonas sp. KR1UV-12]MDP1025998.1 acyl-CoA ligase (AMP-forming), exosortase A system-associated [Sphingomonas sp. KR1UV-12]
MIPLDPIPRPIDHLAVRGQPDAPALIDRTGAMSFAELDAATGAVARALLDRGLVAGDRVATWLPKTRLACIMPLAAARAGLVHVPVNPALRHGQVAHILHDSGATLLVTQPMRAATLERDDVPHDCPVIQEDALPRNGAALPLSSGDPEKLAAILYTSGSTGRPKGVMLSHANLWLGAIAVAHYLRLAPEDRVLAVLPLSFDYGQNQLFSTWAAGGAVMPLDYLAPRDVVKAVARLGATTLAGVPPLWTQLLEIEWEDAGNNLRRLTNSGGALTPRMVRNLRSHFPQADLYAMYGLTEAFRSTWLDPALIDANPDAIGRAIPFADVMVVRPDGQRAIAGEPGELVHAGPLVAHGYWRDAERTAARFRPAPDFAAAGGTAVWSGDTVVEGEDGLLRFVGRDDEMIKTAGNRLSPQEIEEAILSGEEAREAVVVGVPDDRLGQAIVAVVAGDPMQEQALLRRLRTDLPSFMQPARYVWHATLPRNANGKLDRAAIRAEVLR